MADIKEVSLPPWSLSSTNLGESASRPSGSGPPLFQGTDVLGQNKRGQGLRSWIQVDSSGNSQILECDKFTIMRRYDLPARDLRLLDPLFEYPSTILGREKAIVVSLEQIRCIIKADEVLLLNSSDSYVLQYVKELRRRLTSDSNQKRSSSPDCLPFEFRALEVALETVCAFLDTQVSQTELEPSLSCSRILAISPRISEFNTRVNGSCDYIHLVFLASRANHYPRSAFLLGWTGLGPAPNEYHHCCSAVQLMPSSGHV